MQVYFKKVGKEQIIRSLKIAIAAALAIALAGELGLKYSPTAGIITILSIQNTKRETLKSARNRGLAFLAALLIAAACYGIMGYTLWAFVVYLLLFALLCHVAEWKEAISMISVLITHFLTEGTMTWELVLNESLLFLIGTGMGILINLHLHKKEQEFRRLADRVDVQMKGILGRMSEWLIKEDKSDYNGDCFISLSEALEEAKLCAASNYNNELRKADKGELEYIRMREQQCVILQEIYKNIKVLATLPVQAAQVADLFGRIEQGFHKDNTVEGLLMDLAGLLENMKQQPLPESREEFENRAILFYILMQLRNLLQIKREYIMSQKSIA